MGCAKCKSDSLNASQNQVLRTLALSKNPCGSKEIAAASGLDAKEVSGNLSALKKIGYIASPVRCKYEITPEGKKAIA